MHRADDVNLLVENVNTLHKSTGNVLDSSNEFYMIHLRALILIFCN